MKKIFFPIVLVSLSLVWGGCQMASDPASSNPGTAATPVPYSRGPNSAPHVDGPNINLPPQQTENIEFALPKKPEMELRNN